MSILWAENLKGRDHLKGLHRMGGNIKQDLKGPAQTA